MPPLPCPHPPPCLSGLDGAHLGARLESLAGSGPQTAQVLPFFAVQKVWALLLH